MPRKPREDKAIASPIESSSRLKAWVRREPVRKAAKEANKKGMTGSELKSARIEGTMRKAPII